jgi:hypothetical protein
MKVFSLILMLAFTAVLLQGCGKDRNLDDFKKEQLQKNLSEYKSAEGTYTGYLTSKKSGLNMGAVSVNLRAAYNTDPGQDESGSNATPTIITSLEFQGTSRLQVATDKSYYNADSGQFQATFLILQYDTSGHSTSYSILLTGSLHGGQLTGALTALNYENYGATFALSTGSKSIDQLAQDKKPQDAVFAGGTYTGETDFQSGDVKPLNVIFLKPATNSDTDFLNLFLPVKPFEVTLNYGGGALVKFSDSVWDQRVGKLTGHSQLTKSSLNPDGTKAPDQIVDLSLTCDLQDSQTDLNCLINTNNTSVAIAQVRVKYNKDGGSEPPKDPSDSRGSITRHYQGQLLGKGNGGANIPTDLTATYGARTPLDEITDLFSPQSEKNLVITLAFGNTGVTFSNVKWDSVKGTLDATQTSVSDGISVTLTLACQGFFFSDKDYSFTCGYHSILGNTDVQFSFSSAK